MSAGVGRTASFRRVVRGGAVVLTASSVVVVSLLMGGHMPFATLPGAGGAPLATGRWQAVYVLGEKCPCSTRVAKHLAARAPLAGIEEYVLQVGDEPEAEVALRTGGWDVRRRAPEVARDSYGALSAPLLVVVDPRGEVRYRGGISRRSDARDGFHEKQIVAAVQAGRTVKPLPAFGCALRFGCEWGAVEQVVTGSK